MAGPFDLTGQDIENTYQRVLQTDGTLIYDGTGSLFTISGSGGTIDTGSFATTGSNRFIGNQIVTGSLNITDSIYFSGSGAASRLVWNNTDGTLDLGLKGGNVTLQLGQEQVVRVVNKTGANLLESQYKAIRIRRVDEGGAQGQRLAIVLAQANNDANSVDTLGLVTEDINVNQEGFITNSGLVRGIDTTGTLQGETWLDGDALYLSPTTAGSITKVKPQAPQHTITIGYVVYAHQNNGTIFVKVDNGYEIDELHNVRINTGSLTSGDLLVYSSSIWINTKQLTGSYNLTGSLTATSFTGSLLGTATTASYVLNAISSSFASTSSYVQNAQTASYVQNAQTASFFSGTVVSASYAQTSSFVQNAQTASYALFNPYITTIGTRIITDNIYIIEGSKGYKHIGYNANIVKTRTIANTNGNIDVNIKRNGITLGTISLTNQSSSLDTILTGWTTQLNINDLLEFYVSQSSLYITDLTIFIDIQARQ
jgi:hypothetical protein